MKHPRPPRPILDAAERRVRAWLDECSRRGLHMPPDAQRRAWDAALQTETAFHDIDQPPAPEV